VKYPPITQEEKDAYEHPDSAARGKYKFEPHEDKGPKAPAPVEAKAVQPKEEK